MAVKTVVQTDVSRDVKEVVQVDAKVLVMLPAIAAARLDVTLRVKTDVKHHAAQHVKEHAKVVVHVQVNTDLQMKDNSKSITFIVTKDCQLACKYCYLVGKNSKERMSYEIAKRAVDYILGNEPIFNEPGVVWDFIGGEPFLEIDLITQICNYIKKEMYRLDHPWFNHYTFNFSTNGINYHEGKVQRFIEENRNHISIGITIDGTELKHNLNRIYKSSGRGSYKDVVRNIPLWLQQFPDEGTKVTISSEDIPYIKDSVLHLYNLGIHEVNINCVFENVWKEGDDYLFLNQLMELADAIINKGLYKDYDCSLFSEEIGKPLDKSLHNQNWCGAGMMLSVDAAGNFYPCTRFAAYSLREKMPIIIGNVRDGIDKNKLRPFLTLDRTTQSRQECIDCEVASGCAWCQGENYDAAETNTIYQRSTAICKMHKARVRANNYYWNKLYRKLELEGQREEFEKNKREVKTEIC